MIQGHRLRQTREQRALSQEALGKLVAKDGAYISKIERGVLVSVNTTTLERLVTALATSADYLLGLSDQPTPAAPTPRRKEHARNGTHTKTAPLTAHSDAACPRAPLMCPHCAMPMQPLGDGARVGCPGCRYSVEGAT
jgi:transcriptional regulator with XRE-family HTH domain